MSKREDLLSQLKVGDHAMYQNSTTGIYEVISLTHPSYGEEYLSLRHVDLGSRRTDQRAFEYAKREFNKEFTQIYSTSNQRELSRLKFLLLRANLSGDISEIHELLVKVEV